MTVKEAQGRILEGLKELQKDKLNEARAAKKQQKHKARYSAVMFFGLRVGEFQLQIADYLFVVSSFIRDAERRKLVRKQNRAKKALEKSAKGSIERSKIFDCVATLIEIGFLISILVFQSASTRRARSHSTKAQLHPGLHNSVEFMANQHNISILIVVFQHFPFTQPYVSILKENSELTEKGVKIRGSPA